MLKLIDISNILVKVWYVKVDRYFKHFSKGMVR